MSSNPDVFALVEEILDAGRTPEEVCRDCPELLAEVRRRYLAIRLVDGELAALFPDSETLLGADALAAVPPAAELPQVPGYRVEAELGRGGMGVVYRAWHLRLERVVALKMLLADPGARPVQLERFLREAKAVAALSHPNIVQVHDVGEVDGRPFFTMELVEGGNLAEQIQGAPQPARQAAALVATLADAVQVAHQSGIVHRDLKPSNILLQRNRSADYADYAEKKARRSSSSLQSVESVKSADEFLPRIADFGLARRLEGDGALTLSGALLGTPSYMAPEQARGKKQAIGPAVDVYALGAILYELLTGRPPFRGESATATLQQVVADEPVPPARLNPQVPRDLATICLKCLAKEPSRRYASAAALADDLRRFLRGEPIVARRAGSLERLALWARRRPAAATLLVIALVAAATVLGGAGWLMGQWIFTARAVEADLREAVQLQQRSAFPAAGVVLERARARLGDGGPFWLYPAVEEARRDQELLERLDTIHLNRFTLAEAEQGHPAQMHFNLARADRDYAGAFRDAGLGEPGDDPEAVAARVRASRWTAHLVAALDDWAVCVADPARQDWLLAVARRADPDPWRDRVRDPRAWRDGPALAALAREDGRLAGQSLPLLLALGERLSMTGEDGVGFLRRVREHYPEDFWANFTLALALHSAERRPEGHPEPALTYYRKALEIRPRAVAVLNDLGVVLFDKGWIWTGNAGEPGAAAVFHQAMKSDPRFAPAINNFGLTLKTRGWWSAAELIYQDALDVDPRLASTHFNLAEIQAGSGKVKEAIGHHRQVVQLAPEWPGAHYSLGVALLAEGRFDEMDDCFPESVKSFEPFRGPAQAEALAFYWHARNCDPKWTPAWNALRISARDEARLGEALEQFRQAVRLAPHFAWAHGALGEVLLARREFAEAESEIRRSRDLFTEQMKRGEWLPEPGPQLVANLDLLLRRCQQLRALEGRLPAVVQGRDRPAAADCRDLAELGFVKKHYATAARLYVEALAAAPQLTEDVRAGHRFNAARAAALAGSGQGDDAARLSEPEHEALRKQARDGLRLDLAAWARKVETGTLADRIQARKALARWRDDPDLAGLRDANALEKLPAAEQRECRALWQDVAALLRRGNHPQSTRIPQRRREGAPFLLWNL